MGIMDKAILDGKRVKPVKDLMEWANWFETANRSVADHRTGNVRVSTVFLGMDHCAPFGRPLWFETMIFGGEHDQYQERYETWEEAEAGHKNALKLAGIVT